MSDQPAPPIEVEALSWMTTGLLDLTRQQRNLLLMRSLFELELSKLRVGDDSVSEKNLFQGVDTHRLVLCALDLMMEGTIIAMGSTPPEVLIHMAEVARRLKPALEATQFRNVADVVHATLGKKANKFRRSQLSCLTPLQTSFRQRIPDLLHAYQTLNGGRVVSVRIRRSISLSGASVRRTGLESERSRKREAPSPAVF